MNLRVTSRQLFVVVFALLLCSLLSCATTVQNVPEPAYVSPYNWSQLLQENGRYHYYKDGVLVSRVGIDVSEHQGSIDWQAVAADGIDFAIVRLGHRGYTEGDIYLDEQYLANIEAASSAGIEVGVYFFSQAISEEEAREEADFVLENLGGRALDYPVVFDHEPVSDAQGRANNLTRDQVTANAQVFCEHIEAAGYSAMIYGNKRDIARLDKVFLAKYEIWFAEYDARIPTGQFDFSIWQYSSKASVAGVTTRVDMNIHFLTA